MLLRDFHRTWTRGDWRIFYVGITLLMWLGFGVAAVSSTDCPSFEQVRASATIRDTRLSEISGLVASRSQPGILWVHNDSGDAGAVYAIDFEGRLLAVVQLARSDGTTLHPVDCEDIAIGPGPDDNDYLYLADIGDNRASRETIFVYRFKEPQLAVDENGSIVQVTAACDGLEAFYPDGARDAETFLVDPVRGDLVIISKDFIHARAYRMTSRVDTVFPLEFLVQLTWGFITGGDISADGSSIILRGYWNAQIWSRPLDEEWWTILATSGCPAALAVEPQGEAIGFGASGGGYFTITEGFQPQVCRYFPI